MGIDIHPSAVVSQKAEIDDGVTIGPFSIIGEKVTIGRDSVIGSHVVIDGNTIIGEKNRIYPFVSLGLPPQDIGYQGEDTSVIIGDENIIREFVTINRATTKQDRVTKIGNKNYLMAYAHIAHDWSYRDRRPCHHWGSGSHTSVCKDRSLCFYWREISHGQRYPSFHDSLWRQG